MGGAYELFCSIRHKVRQKRQTTSYQWGKCLRFLCFVAVNNHFQVCEMKNCTKCIFFEMKKKKDLYMWVSNVPNGPSAKFLVENGRFLVISNNHATFVQTLEGNVELVLVIGINNSTCIGVQYSSSSDMQNWSCTVMTVMSIELKVLKYGILVGTMECVWT